MRPPEAMFAPDARYQIVRRLGSGGMGEVFEAIDTRRDVSVALKTLSEASPLSLYLFKNEFRALADLSHPNLVGLYELGQSEDTPWFTMELVPAATDLLTHFRGTDHSSGRSWLTAQGDLDPDATLPPMLLDTLPEVPRELPDPSPLDPSRYPELRDAIGQLADALHTLHVSGRLHRDVKPANVLVSDGRVVLVDFGLVATLDGVARAAPGVIAGSIPYMSPEQSVGAELGPASDWYAFGAVLYELLTGRPPFAGARAAVLAAKRGREIVPAAQVVTGVPADLDDLCTRLLALEATDRPDGDEVRALLGRTARIARNADVDLVGRKPHRSVLDEAIARVRAGKAATVHVHGDSGMGKSALVDAFLDAQTDALVLHGRCYERDTLPFKAIDPLVDALTRWLSRLPRTQAAALAPRYVRSLMRLFPVLQRIEAFAEAEQRTVMEPEEEQRRALLALRDLLARVSEQQTLVLYIDDLQWGDRDSLVALRELLREPDPPVMLLVLAYRTSALADPELTGLVPQAPRVAVGPLDTSDATQLAATQLEEDTLRDAVVAEAEGSPFYTLELARHAARTGHLVDLQAYALERIAELPEAARGLVQTLAIAGIPTRRSVLLDSSEQASVAALTALQAGRLVRSEGADDDDRIAFDHDRIRESIADTVPAELVPDIHARLAGSLIRHDGDAERISNHLLAAGDTRRATHFARLAADHAAETLAFHREVAMLRRLLDLTGEGPERSGLLERYGKALASSGRGREAAHALLASVEAGAHPRLEIEAARLLLYTGHLEEGRPVARRVLSRFGVRVPRWKPVLLVEGLLRRLWQRMRPLKPNVRPDPAITAEELDRLEALNAIGNGLIISDQVTAYYLLTRFIGEAFRIGHASHVVAALGDDAFIANAEPGGSRRCDRAYALAQSLTDRAEPRHVAWMETLRMIALIQLGRVGEAGQGITNAMRYWEEARLLGMERDWTEMFDVGLSAYRDGPAAFVKREGQLVARALERQNLGLAIHTRVGVYSLAGLMRDDPDGLEAHIHDLLDQWDGVGDLQCFYAQQSLVRIAVYRGDGVAAAAIIDAQQAMVRGSGAFQSGSNRMTWAFTIGAACLTAFSQTGDPSWLTRAMAAAKSASAEGPWGELSATFIRALVKARRGDPSCRAHFEEAIRLATQEKLTTWLQFCRWHLAHVDGDDATVAAVEEWARSETIVDPPRWLAAWCGPPVSATIDP